MSLSDTAISVRNLSKAYTIAHNATTHTTLAEAMMHRLRRPLQRPQHETFWALRDMSIEIKKGEVVGVIGRNGAGKSTFLKILSRITEPTSGKVDLYGRIGSLLEVGTGFHPELTGRENIYLNGQILGMRRREIERQFDAIVDFAEVEQFLDTPVKRYSSGMYVRLAFAVAAHLNPDILLIDEVLAVGDAEFQKKCLGRMGQLVGEKGRTILFVSHNMGAVRSLCQNVVWLEKGQVKMIGPTADVLEGYFQLSEGESGGRIDVRDLARPQWLSQRLKIISVELNGGKSVFHGEEFRAEFEIEVGANIEGVSLGLGLATMDGTRVITVDSDLGGDRHSLVRGTRISVEFSIEQLHLNPGRYLLDIGGRSGDGTAVDYLAGCAVVEVLPGMNTPALLVREGGGVRLPAHWTWHGVTRFADPTPTAVAAAG
jgi:lipopolysaccharide transport system ATP-binding protein